MKSITLEDTFNDYGLSVWRHLENDNDAFDIISDSGRIQSEHMITKQKFVFDAKKCQWISKTIFENLQTKHYIRLGEECPICYECIIHKNEANLTNCGHAFHYKCIIDYDYHCSFQGDLNKGAYCPICRQEIGYFSELKNKFFNACNRLDKLEDMNNTLHITNPLFCFSCKKVKGINKNCKTCKDYINIIIPKYNRKNI